MRRKANNHRLLSLLLIVRCYIGGLFVIVILNEEFMITVKLGSRIRELRQKIGLSQEKFALLIEMDRTYYASVELGKRNISIINIEKIANGLGVSLSELFLTIDNCKEDFNDKLSI